MTQTDQAIADAIAASIEGTDGRFSIEVKIGEGKVAEVSGRYETEGYSEDDRLSMDHHSRKGEGRRVQGVRGP